MQLWKEKYSCCVSGWDAFMLDGGGTRDYAGNKQGIGVRRHRESLPQASGNAGSSNPTAVVGLKAQAL